jgi:hypothetical protein
MIAPAPPRSVLRLARALVLPPILVLGVVGCGDPEATEEAELASVQKALEVYAPRLADAYAVADLEGLEAYSQENTIDDPRVREIMDRYEELAALPLRERLAIILEGVAVEKEVAGLEKRIDDLLAEGRVIRPTPKSIVVEDVESWGYANAFATTVETWDLRVYTSGTGVLLSETLDQRNRAKYQLQRVDDTWLVLWRELQATFE